MKKYRLWIINTQTEAGLYLWPKWKDLVPQIDVLVHLSNQPAYIRSFQGYETENRWLGFGRMKWSEPNNILWTTKYREEGADLKHLVFFKTEIWAPDWNVANKNGPPDIYIVLYHNPELPTIREGLIIAMPRKLYDKNHSDVDDVLSKLSANIPGSSVTAITRYWKPFWQIANEISALNPQEIQKIVS